MGEVYRAKDIRLGRDVAVKVLPKEFATHPERMQRFEREARSASALNHPAIITIYDVGFSGTDAYIAMEYIDGKNLAELLSAGRLQLKKIIAIATQFADALAKAHEAGIVHRDLKPENLMITSDGFLKILDFGLAKLTNPAVDVSTIQTQTSAGMVLGTAAYMSPEQAAGKVVDFRSDQFSFGSIFYEMVTGRRAFHKNSAPETMAAIIRDEVEPVLSIVPNLPAPIRWIIERCMSKNPDERYASTRDLAHDLQGVRDHFSEITSSDSNQSLQAIKPQNHLLLPLAIILALAAGALLTYWFHRTPPQTPAVFRTLTYSGSDSSPTVSSNGQLVAFRSDRDGTPRIWLKQLKGGNEVAITSGPDDLPRFSPDGSLLLFIRNEATSASLFRVPVLGGEERKIIEDVRSADWSPDGNRIAFIRWKAAQGNPDSQFFIVNPDGSNVQQLAEIKERQLQSVRWSPDGHYLVATVIIQGNYGSRDAIALIDVQNKKTQWILSSYSWPTSAVWTGTKNQIAYFSPETGVALFQLRGDSTLYLHDVETGERKPVFWAQSAGEIMDIAGKGRIVMHSASLRENLREVTLNGKQDSTEISSWLTRGNSCNRQPVYSPDGKHILFSSNMAANLDLWEVSTDSRALRRITEDAAGDWDPTYSPDGKHILWSSNRNGHFEIWMANADGSGARQVTKDGVDAENPAMTLDGKWVIYNSYNPDLKIRGIWKIHPDGSGGVRIASGLTQWPEVSPDGRYASYGFYKQSLNDPITYERVVEIESGVQLPFEIKVSNRDRVGGRMRWMPDGKSIVFIDENEKGNWGLFAQDFISGKDTSASRRAIAGFDVDRKIDTFTIAPDSSNIVLAEVEVLSSLIMAEGIPGIEPQHK
jgi:eukaryotic-like serine/threonine-protein kinase